MMTISEKILKAIAIALFFLMSFYFALPNPDFPKPPPDSIQSYEPADIETPFRRSYFTNFTRSEVMDWYVNQFNKSTFMDISLPTYRLNYGPEEAQMLIRDQARSTFLEEIVHPFRESVYVNGFEPTEIKDDIFIENKHWRQKITVKLVVSTIYIRMFVLLGLAVCVLLISSLVRKIKINKSK